MSFGTFSFGQSQATPAFGQSSPSLFGAAPAAPFGAQPASSPFGQTGGGLFGGSATPAFGQQSTPGFGTPASTPAFGGSSGFGAAPTSSFGFGASPAFGQSAPAFGAQSTPAFGAQSAAAFGAQSTPAFGSSGFGAGGAFGGGAFGASRPAFGAQSAPAFGAAPTPSFGGSPGGFGAAPAAFGQTPGFGAQQAATGTRAVPWRKTPSSDSTSGRSDGNYMSITAMSEYAGKSFEELRWEDYQAGCKGNTGGTPPGSTSFGGSTFGAQSPQPFGTPSSGFGASSTPAFGQTSMPAFGASSSPAFGSTGFGASSTPAFGATSTPAFGQSSTPAFGQTPGFGAQSTPAFGSSFGGQSAPAFGASSSNPFGAQSSPAFGSTGFNFGGAPASTPGFGAPQSAPAFGSTGFGFAQSSTPAFGSSTPAFGQQQSAPAFSFNTGGGFGTPQQSPGFGASSPATGFGSSAPAFGGGGIFGNSQQQQQQRPGQSGFGQFGQSSASGIFGGASAPAFGQSQGGGLFGSSTPAFGGGGMFPTATQPAQGFSSPSFGPASQQQPSFQQQQQPQLQLAIADPNANPFGFMPEPPKIPEYATGLAARPGLGTSFSRSSPLLVPRAFSRSTPGATFGRPPARARSKPSSSGVSDAVIPAPEPAPSLVLTPRSNPRHLFVHHQLPSTEASPSFSPSPADADKGKGRAEYREEDQPGPSKPAGQQEDNAEGGRSVQDQSRQQSGRAMQEEAEEEDGNDEQLSDAQIKQLLPILAGTEFSISPSEAQLAMLARSEGSAELKRIANFSVTHKMWGSVRWLEPVDIRGLPLKDVVIIAKSNVSVYPEDGPAKPDLGDSLNKPAEISLYKVYKRDANSNAVKEGPELDKFVQKLKKTASRQGTEHVDYDADKGIWRFRVEHFSRYGLIDSSDDEDDGQTEPMQDKTPPGKTAQASKSNAPSKDAQNMDAEGGPAASGFGLFDEDEDMEDDLGSDQTGGVNLDGTDDRGLESFLQPASRTASGHLMMEDDDMPSPSPEQARRSPELALALSAGYQHDPEELMHMQQALFTGPQLDGPAGPKRRSKSADPAPFIKPATFAEGQAPNVWRRPQPALQPPTNTSQEEPASPSSTALVIADLPTSHASSQPEAHKFDVNATSGCLVDAGLMLGQSCRVGWSPNGTLVIPGRGALQSGITFARIAHLPTPVFPRADRRKPVKEQRQILKQQEDTQRRHLEQALQLHLESSLPDPAQPSGAVTVTDGLSDPMLADEQDSYPPASAQDDSGPVIPRWRLKCKCESELEVLHDKLTSLSKAILDNADKVQALVVQQQMYTWTLVFVLYAAIDDRSEIDLADRPIWPTMQRRADLSHWLQVAAAPGMQAGLHGNRPSGLQQIASLLSGHQTAAAAVVAASLGDVRLATLISQAGVSSRVQQLVKKQLDKWQEQSWEDEAYSQHIDEDRLLIYQLLAGQVHAITPRLNLDWRQALGLHFWYKQPTTASVAEVLDSYAASVSQGQGTPGPKPLYLESHGVSPPKDANAAHSAAHTFANATDFQLLRLAAEDLPSTDIKSGLGELLHPAGVTPDPLDHSFVWQLLTVLQAVDALSVEDASGCAPIQVFQLHMSLIAQLENLGHMAHWAVYVALHIPDHPAQEWHFLREHVVQELLRRHAPVWASDSRTQDFLLHKLHVPAAWLDQALAQWASYCHDDSDELQHLLQAEQWDEAHQLLWLHLAPQLFFASHTQEDAYPTEQQQRLQSQLQHLISRLQPHAAQLTDSDDATNPADIHAQHASWDQGVGVYATYYALQEQFRSAGRRAEQQQQRMHQNLGFAHQLQDVASLWSQGSGATLRQVVLSELSASVANWLLKDTSSAQQQPADFTFDSLNTDSNLLNLQLAAGWLAQAAG